MNLSIAEEFLKFKKFTPIEIGVKNLIDWYKKNY